MANAYISQNIDEYLRKRLTPVESSIPHLPGIEIYGDSVPAGTVGGDLFEYINFPRRYNIDARIQRAQKLLSTYLDPLPRGGTPRNSVDDHVGWLKSRPGYKTEMELEYRDARSSEQARVTEDLHLLYDSAGVLIVDAQGHGVISAKIASTVHDTFHALMLADLDRSGRTTPELFERMNLRMAQAITARNELGEIEREHAREVATMLYGEVHRDGHFRFVNFGHPPPLVFSIERDRFIEIDSAAIVQFPALGLQIPEDHPDRNRYYSIQLRQKCARASDLEELTLNGRGDILFLYTDGVYDGSDDTKRLQIEAVIRKYSYLPPREICNAILEFAVKEDHQLSQLGEDDRIDDKTVFIIKRCSEGDKGSK
jgi:serine phosphatase RsbU (regulator of sigma subunit)